MTIIVVFLFKEPRHASMNVWQALFMHRHTNAHTENQAGA